MAPWSVPEMAEPSLVSRVGAIERLLSDSFQVTFEDRRLLQLALVHSSYLNENPEEFTESNERLEFLGDAVIGLAIAEELFRRRPLEPEGELTTLRAELVKRSTLAEVGRALDLGGHLIMGKGEAESGGRQRDSNLADAFEAVTGAIFQDQGYGAARNFVIEAMAKQLDAPGLPEYDANPKSTLQEFVQSKDGSQPIYRLVTITGEDHARKFEVEVLVSGRPAGRGTGSRKSGAEQAAARRALETLGWTGREAASRPRPDGANDP